MAQNKVKYPKLTSGTFTAKFPYLHEPNTRFSTEGKYEVKYADDPSSKQFKSLKNEITELGKKVYKEAFDKPFPKKGTWPWSPEMAYAEGADRDVDDPEPTGREEMVFRLAAAWKDKESKKVHKRNLPVYDAKGNLMQDVPVWGGSEIQVRFNVKPWKTPTGTGITLQLISVRVMKLVTSGGAEAGKEGFDWDDVPDDAYEYSEDDSQAQVKSKSDNKSGDNSDDEGEDDEDWDY